MKKRDKSCTFIEISFTSDGKIQTAFNPKNGLDTIQIGIALASATRVISAAIIDCLKLDKTHLKPIQEQIAKFYNDDLFKFGTLGEEENTKTKNCE